MWTLTLLHLHCLLVVLLHLVGAQAVVASGEASDVSEYDFVVVGGGTSGLTVADRLTENDKVSVLVLEYGPLDRHEASVLVPGLLNLTSTPYWFGLRSTPQGGLNNASFSVPSAAVVGGGSVINGMFFDRGAASDYDAWRDLGNPGWGWEDMLPYFKKSETFTPAPPDLAEKFNITFDASVHGNDGPVQSSYPVFQWANVANFLRAWRNVGPASPKDPDGGTKAGVLYVPSSLDARNQSRSYSRFAHFDRVVQGRSNYRLITEVAVGRILFEGKTSVGVEYIDRKTNVTSRVKCKREVILAAGAPHSPQILQLSGVGPADVLRSLDIPVTIDLPGVGFNLQDHPTLYSKFALQNQPRPNLDDLTTNETYARQQLDIYYSERKGPFTIVNQGGNTIADLPLPYITDDYEDIISQASEQLYASIYPGLDSSVLAGYDAQRNLVLEAYRSNTTSIQETGYNGGIVVPITLLKPLSRGSVLINSTSVFAPPLFDWGAMAFPTDLDILIASLRATRRIYADAAMQELEPVEVTPGAHLTSNDELGVALRRLLQPTYSHPCGTCAMMPREQGGVVAPDLKVYGIQGLRVVDASIMPLIPSAHTSATVYAVAEKAADMIKAEYGWAR